MKSEKTLLLTFDYELFLGARSGNVLESVINPTNEILAILDEFQIQAIFFVDTTWLIKLRELAYIYPACRNKYQLVASQIINICKSGHAVFPHLHPHWMDAVYNNKTDEFNLNDISHYRLNQLNQEERNKLFDESIDILKSIINKEFTDYKIDGFRAGGWSIQPFSDFKSNFIKHGIRYDFSVMPLVYQFTEAQHFDFSNAPAKPVYQFSEDVTKENILGQFTEITSNIIYIEPWRKWIDKIHQKLRFRILRDSTHKKGIGVYSKNLNNKPTSIFGIELSNTNYERVSIELLSRIKLNSYKKIIANNDFVQFVSHPKIITRHNLKMLKCLLKFVVQQYDINSNFRYFSEKLIKPTSNSVVLNSHSTNVTPVGNISTEIMNTISVVIPCYNVAEYIQEAIQSVISQTVKCIEIICVDDCSTDNTLEILTQLQSQYPALIKIIQNTKNSGANISRNKGLMASNGNFIQFLDADDILLPNKFDHQLNIIQNLSNGVDLIVGGFKKRNLAGKDTTFSFEKDDHWNGLMRGRLGVTTANLFRKQSIIEAGGWNENLKSSQEYDLMFRMLKTGAKVHIDNEVMNINRERSSGSITKSNPEAKWIRFINLRVDIFNYLLENNLMNDKIKNTFINEVFNSIRIIYYYNKEVAIDLHRKFIVPNGKPDSAHSASKKYLLIYKLFGFKTAQLLATFLHPVKPI